MRILVVTPYAPIRDGIASYALQQVKALRAEGHDVEVLSPQPSAAHHHLDLRRPRGTLALARRVRRYDKVVVQFHPDVFFVEVGSGLRRAASTAGLLLVALAAKRLEVLVHEIDYERARRLGPEAVLARRLWHQVDVVAVHTEAERRQMEVAFGLRPGQVEVVDHGSHFLRRVELDRQAARARLGLPAQGHVFLAIGFIQPHKGFDRAVRALRALPEGCASLHVVGSLRLEDRRYLRYLEELRAEVAATPGAHLHESYVSDELFDVWIIASDTVVLPYRHIWSSSVLERAALYERRVIVTDVGGLAAQAPERSTVVSDDLELAEAMAAAAAGGAEVEPPGAAGEEQEAVGADREAVMRLIRRRAAAERGRPLLVERAPRGASGAGRAGGARAGYGPSSLDPLQLPPTVSTRPLAALVKRIVRRLTAWELDPVVERVNDLQRAVAEIEGRSRGSQS